MAGRILKEQWPVPNHLVIYPNAKLGDEPREGTHFPIAVTTQPPAAIGRPPYRKEPVK